MDWHCKHFDGLKLDELYQILAARTGVFVMEQNCLYNDVDGRDNRCLHLFAQDDAGGQPIIAAYLRLLPPGLVYPEAAIGRVLTTAAYRGTGIGRELMARALEQAHAHWPGSAVRINAQAYLQNFYESFGFVLVKGPYDEDGIPHVEMLRAALC